MSSRDLRHAVHALEIAAEDGDVDAREVKLF
jgi:hypothetical protein